MTYIIKFRRVFAPCAALFVAFVALLAGDVSLVGAVIAGVITWLAAAFALAPGKASRPPTAGEDASPD